MKLRYTQAASLELEESLVWYAEHNLRAAQRLADEVVAGERMLAGHPLLGTVKTGNVRFLPLHDFPYSLIYAIRSNEIVVIAFAHHSRRPGYWLNRLQEQD